MQVCSYRGGELSQIIFRGTLNGIGDFYSRYIGYQQNPKQQPLICYTNIECLLAHLSSAVGFIPTVNGTVCDMVEVLIIFLLLLAGGIID